MHTGRTELPRGGDALPTQNLDLRCQILEIELRCEEMKAQEYRKLLEPFCDRHAAVMPEAPPGHQQQPRLVARDDDRRLDRRSRGRHQRPRIPPVAAMPPEAAHRVSSSNGIIAKLCDSTSAHDRTAIFRAVGVHGRKPAPREAARARKTPDIPWLTFSKVFGGSPHNERPTGRVVSGYETGHFLCANTEAQPLAPICIGEPGVILSAPGARLHDTFHLFVDPSNGRRTCLQYRGVYTGVRTPKKVPIDDWHMLPVKCTRSMLMTLRRSKVCDLHARCTLRKRKRSEPSIAEIEEWTQRYHQGSETMEMRAIHDAFNSGAEKYSFQVIKCIGYDMRLAELIQEGVDHYAQ